MRSNFPPSAEPPRVVREMTRGVVGVEPDRLGDGRVHAPSPVRHVLGRDERVGLRVVAVLVDQPQRVEDLHRPVRVQAREDLRDRAEVAVDELAQAAVVVDGAGPGTAATNSSKSGCRRCSGRRRRAGIPGTRPRPPPEGRAGPGPRFARAARTAPATRAHGVRIEVRRDRQRRHPPTSGTKRTRSSRSASRRRRCGARPPGAARRPRPARRAGRRERAARPVRAGSTRCGGDVDRLVRRVVGESARAVADHQRHVLDPAARRLSAACRESDSRTSIEYT